VLMFGRAADFFFDSAMPKQ